MESIVEGLIEAKLRRLKEAFHSEIEQLKADNNMLEENDEKQEKLIRKLLNERENDAIASTTDFCRQNIKIS